MTIVTLSGSQNVTGSQKISDLYRNLWTTWSAQGISTEMGYSAEQFVVLPVQANCKLAKTQLTNYDFNGKQLQTWNCTYVMVKEGENWLINLVTSDNQASAKWLGQHQVVQRFLFPMVALAALIQASTS